MLEAALHRVGHGILSLIVLKGVFNAYVSPVGVFLTGISKQSGPVYHEVRAQMMRALEV